MNNEVIQSQSEKEIIILPYGETHTYRFGVGKTGPMKEYGLAIARCEQGLFYGGCIPVDALDELLKLICTIRGYEIPVKKVEQPIVRAIF